MMIEYEKKVMLTLWEYVRLLNISNDTRKTFEQTNYYYDTVDFALHRQKITCRIREKNGKYTATTKMHGVDGADSSREISETVRSAVDTSVFEFPDLILHGKLLTKRTIIFENSDIEVAVDKNSYLGCTDYELEIERRNDSHQQTEQVLRQLAYKLYGMDNIFLIDAFFQRINAVQSKSERFFERLQNKEKIESERDE